MASIGTDIHHAAELLKNGQLVAIPTETVYGLAGNALNEKAVLSIFEAKNRPFFDPLILHVPSVAAVTEYANWHDERLLKLASAVWPGPLTVLLPRKNNVPDLVTSGLPQVAMRVPDHPLALSLLQLCALPLAAPSANPFGYVSPTTPKHVDRQLGEKVSYILDGGPCKVGLESTIVGVEEGQLCVYRLGGLPLEKIEDIAGPYVLKINSSGDPKAPGQLKSHYAPRKPLLFGKIQELINSHPQKKIALIVFGPNVHVLPAMLVYNLSESGSLEEAALNLFRVLREADDSDAELVIAETLPDNGLGRAINDRLKRAAVR